MRLFVVGVSADLKLIRAALDGILVMHERETSETRSGLGASDDVPLVITAGRTTGVDYAVSQWHSWYRQNACGLITLETWWGDNKRMPELRHRDAVNAAFMLKPTHLLAFYPGGWEGLSDYDRYAYEKANEAKIPCWTFQGGQTAEA